MILISLDTLRADHTGFGGYERPTTPFLDSLAERARVFENHYANSQCTLPSHATMLTGLHQLSHGAIPVNPKKKDLRTLPRSADTLAERLRDGGFRTAAFTSHGAWLTEAYGFDQGFDRFESGWVDAPVVVEQYLDWLDGLEPEEDRFAFLHFFDIHSEHAKEGPCLPYEAPPELVRRFAGDSPPGFTGCSPREGRESRCASTYLKDVSRGRDTIPEDHLEYLVGLYDAGIRALDDELRALFDELERRGELDNALIVITSDHGENFGEHGNMLHDGFNDQVARVPLILLLPENADVEPRGVQAITQSASLSATLLELVGLDPIGQVPSIASDLVAGEEPRDDDVVFKNHVLIGRDAQGAYKLVELGGDRPPLFYDLDRDPLESRNLMLEEDYVERHSERLREIRNRIASLRAESKAINDSLKAVEEGGYGELSEEQVERLQGLGYIGD